MRTERRQRKEISFQFHLLNRSKPGNDILVGLQRRYKTYVVRPCSPKTRRRKQVKSRCQQAIPFRFVSFRFVELYFVFVRYSAV